MFELTSKAKSRLKEDLHNERKNRSEFARVIYSPFNPARIGFKLDRERENDLVICDNEGEKLLLLDPDVKKRLGTFILDYYECGNEGIFVIKKSENKLPGRRRRSILRREETRRSARY